jgi:hypothetical protein
VPRCNENPASHETLHRSLLRHKCNYQIDPSKYPEVLR